MKAHVMLIIENILNKLGSNSGQDRAISVLLQDNALDGWYEFISWVNSRKTEPSGLRKKDTPLYYSGR